MSSTGCIYRWKSLVRHLWAIKCQCKVLPFPSLLFPFHMECQITHAKPLLGLHPGCSSLHRTHCHSHSCAYHAYLSLSSQSVCPVLHHYSNPQPLLLFMNSFSHFSLHITSPSLPHSFLSFFVCSFKPKQTMMMTEKLSQSCTVETLHASRGDRERPKIKFLSTCLQPEGTGACWSTQQHEVGKGGCSS